MNQIWILICNEMLNAMKLLNSGLDEVVLFTLFVSGLQKMDTAEQFAVDHFHVNFIKSPVYYYYCTAKLLLAYFKKRKTTFVCPPMKHDDFDAQLSGAHSYLEKFFSMCTN